MGNILLVLLGFALDLKKKKLNKSEILSSV